MHWGPVDGFLVQNTIFKEISALLFVQRGVRSGMDSAPQKTDRKAHVLLSFSILNYFRFEAVQPIFLLTKTCSCSVAI